MYKKPRQEKFNGQVLCGPFSSEDLPEFQAACVHFDQQWWRFLSDTEAEFVKAVMYRTARLGPKYHYRKIPIRWFFDGHLGNTGTGYAGCPAMVPVSQKTFYQVRRTLMEYGIVVFDNDRYSINYSITAIELTRNEKVQKRLLKKYKGGGLLSTIEGIKKWANQCAELLTLTNTRNPENLPQESTQEKKSSTSVTCRNGRRGTNSESNQEVLCQLISETQEGTRSKSSLVKNSSETKISNKTCKEDYDPIGVIHNTHVYISSDKSSEICEEDITDMDKKAADILASVHASVDASRSRVSAKRRKRRTLADECVLFEQAWAKGQRERSSSIPPSRISSADKRLLKDQLISPSRGTELDIEALAEWVATHWDAIGAQYFQKSKSYPDYPAFRWFIKCLETYLVAFEQKDYLDEAGTRNTTELLKRNEQSIAADAEATQTLVAARKEIEVLKAENRDLEKRNKRLVAAEHADDYDDDWSAELKSITKSARKPKRRRVK